MLAIFIINVIIGIITIYFGFKRQPQQMSLYLFTIISLVGGAGLIIGSLPLINNNPVEDSAYLLLEIGFGWVIVGIALLIVSHFKRSFKPARQIILKNIACGLEILGLLFLFLVINENITLKKIIIPELYMIAGIYLFYLSNAQK